MIDYICPNCNHHIRTSDRRGGQRSHCPQCKHAVTLSDVTGVVTRSKAELLAAEQQATARGPALRHGPIERPQTSFSLNWGGLDLNEQVGIIGLILALLLILMFAGFAWPSF